MEPVEGARDLATRYLRIRRATLRLAAPLSPEDCQAQSMAEASPVKWHLAHTTWFFDALVLAPHVPKGQIAPEWNRLFNSYYESLGDRIPRERRGTMTRPTLEEILSYRERTDAAVAELLAGPSGPWNASLELGLQHEQQHQELILSDIQHLFSLNPLLPAYARETPSLPSSAAPLAWVPFPGGRVELGRRASEEGFGYDNESPAHETVLRPFRLASRLVTCGEYLEFMRDRGYGRPELWLSDGWDEVRRQAWDAPLYWKRRDGAWHVFTLLGMRPVDPEEPVCHVSFYEADAYARWAGARLPREEEWETAARTLPVAEPSVEPGRLHPAPARGTGLAQLFGDAWQWTSSPYVAYPGFVPLPGPAGEYNGKFMCNQMVLRGSSCVTPAGHARTTYRNFFPPSTRWQFSGIRTAQ